MNERHPVNLWKALQNMSLLLFASAVGDVLTGRDLYAVNSYDVEISFMGMYKRIAALGLCAHTNVR